MSALLNPKLVMFFATFLPQFIDSRQAVLPHMLLLGVLFDVMVLVWLTSYGLFVTRLRTFFSAARVRRTMERFTGVVLVALGARLALEKS
ncbi:MAG: LysE family transporter [Chloroflexota bacterium]|nr:LysE family transporter [Chloroflexota bacterium]